MKKPKTSGSEFVYISMAAFNGSGYADKTSPETYIESYRAYNKWKKRAYHLELLDKHLDEASIFAEHLVEANDSGRYPTDKNYAKFMAVYRPSVEVQPRQKNMSLFK